MEIDLDRPLIPKVKIGSRWRAVEYEGFHLICFHCGLFGHSKEKCPDNGLKDDIPIDVDVDVEVHPNSGNSRGKLKVPRDLDRPVGTNSEILGFGPWMMVTQKGRRSLFVKSQETNQLNTRSSGGVGLSGKPRVVRSGSRFDILNSEKESMFLDNS
ncbi:reverse transcriptase [Quillaja saponaria]|uniref:Reverse transcriptase n=1 Tax=Quillaja saponaria TaxID=32244 RepID=A0AAD7VDM8_QUISA|nr:reverse transcriptase [Quillaja saponaria]